MNGKRIFGDLANRKPVSTAKVREYRKNWEKRMRRPKKAPREILSTRHSFCKGYPWQIDTLTPFAEATSPEARLIQVACVSPNEGGRSSRISRVVTRYLIESVFL